MPRSRSKIPHGTNAGYRKGCRLECCRTAHAQAQRDYRAAKKDPAAAPQVVDEGPQEPRADLPEIDEAWGKYQGPIERAVRAELKDFDAVISFKDTLGQMAIFNAKILDLTPVHQRFDVASGVQLRMLDIFRRLNETGLEGSGASADDPAGDLTNAE